MRLQETIEIIKSDDYLKYLVPEKALPMFQKAREQAVESLEKQKILEEYIAEFRIMSKQCRTVTAHEVLVMLENLKI